MPLNREAYTRYRIIDELLRKKPYPTLEVLIDKISEKFDRPVSKRTVQLDLQEMRYNQALGFSAPIAYNRKEKFYKYEDENFSINNLPVTADELHGLDFAISILDQFKHLPAINEFEEVIIKIASTVKLNKEARGEADYIQLDKAFQVKGIEYVEPIVRAIRERRVIEFTYQKFGSDHVSHHRLEPYLIREAKNFWYVIGNGISKADHKILTFALDRMEDLKVTDQTYNDEKIDKKSFYDNVLGVTIAEGKPEEVLLSFTPLQARYVKTMPIHHSQKIVSESNSEVVLSVKLVINHELKMQLLSYGAHVQVLEPLSLRNEFKTIIASMQKNYIG